MSLSRVIQLIVFFIFLLFLFFSYLIQFSFGLTAGEHFLSFLWDMARIVPFAFILIGLFEVWVPRKKIEKHLGENSGLIAHLWVFLLAGTTVGGLYLAFPIAYSLYKKGANLRIVFSYLGSAAVCRIPMTLFEASFLGLQFTLLRYAVSIPLIIVTAELLGRHLQKTGFSMSSPENPETA
ncbi:MAG: permease [Spirochaetia bacterium]